MSNSSIYEIFSYIKEIDKTIDAIHSHYECILSMLCLKKDWRKDENR